MFVELMGRIITVRRIKFKDDCQPGQFIGDKDTILLAKGMKKRLERSVLRHELVHAMLYYSGISSVINSDIEEQIATLFEIHGKDIQRIKITE